MVSKAITPADTGELDFDRDLEGFEEVETDLGEKIEWSETPGFRGVYLGMSEVFAADQKTGEIVPILVHNFKDGHGELRFAWHSPKLDRGLGKAPVGAEVAILWLGKEKLDAVRTINTFRVAIKPPTV